MNARREPIRTATGRFPEQAVPQDEHDYTSYSRVWTDGYEAGTDDMRAPALGLWMLLAFVSLVAFICGLSVGVISTAALR